MPYKITFCLFLQFLFSNAYTQENNIAIGSWRVHLPYQNMNTLAVSPEMVYTAAGNSIFHLDKTDNSISADSKYSGLNDVTISKVGFNATKNTFLIGYTSGNIDLINGNVITNVNDIYRKNFTGSKTINHFHSYDHLVYVSGDFGLLLYNLEKKEVKESYTNLTSNGASNAVYASTITTDRDSIFIATANGIMVAKLNSATNLMDFNSWYTFQTTDSIDETNIVSVCASNGIVYAAVKNKGIYAYNGNKWVKTTVPITGGGTIRSLTASGNSVLACVDTSLFQLFNPSSWIELFHTPNATPTEAFFDEENTLWMSTLNSGLMRIKNNQTNSYYPNGPLTKGIFRFGYYENNIVGLVGGYNSIGQKSFYADWFSTFENNYEWKSGYFKYNNIPAYYNDFISATYNTSNSKLYLSSFGNGLVELDPKTLTTQLYTNTNSPLKKDISNNYVFVGETALDEEGKLWIPIQNVATGLSNLHSLSDDGTWTNYAVSSSVSKGFVSITIDNLNNKWIKSAAPSGNSGAVIFNEKTNLTRTLSTIPGQGGLPDSRVNCITKDKNGLVYVGTDKGLAVCYDPSTILNDGVDLTTPIYEGFPILFDKNVLCIEVDGGNRKWIGTNDGVWLFNDDLTKVLAYYDKENSPLLSDYVLAIKIHPLSGEVFFATSEGMTSYRGTSTEGEETFSDIMVFPNPVKPGFTGLVGISGLATDASVKITDIAGNLVYQTKAEGGTAVWNVKDYNGKKAATGVYLIFCSDAGGSAKLVSKLAIVE